MSWHRSQQPASNGLPNAQPFRQANPLAAMAAAAMFATNRPLLENAIAQLMQSVQNIPTDIDWLQFQSGVMRYTSNTVPAINPPYPVLATSGRISLRDAGGEGPPIVLIPSMVNKGYVLDLHPGYSLTEHLRTSGFRVLLIDWGTPTPDAILTLTQVITDHLEPLLNTAHQQFGALTLFGYCMGGLLALAATVRLNTAHPGTVGKLALAAMPWDFAATTSASHMQVAKPLLEPWLNPESGTPALVPPEVMSHYFWSLDPWSPIRRLMAYGREFNPDRLAQMTALEDWLNDGLPLDGPIAREMLFDWYVDNTPLKGQWNIHDTPILPASINCPLWVCITQNDLLVPTASSLPFIGQSKNAQVVMSDTGHIGLVCGRRAKERLYDPLTNWLKS
ncbi:MAG: alpha/beta fold hydrolase [Rubrivivax sp.]|nr:MAG: alpha/beta fold hydrolase [Rubrivivax sp.]